MIASSVDDNDTDDDDYDDDLDPLSIAMWRKNRLEREEYIAVT